MMKFGGKRRTLAVTAGVAVVALAIAAVALAADAFQNVTYTSIAGTNLHASQVNSDSRSFTQECTGGEPITGSEVLWHFVLTQTANANTSQLKVQFQNAGVTVPTITSYKTSGGVLHWNVITPGDDVLLAASTDATTNGGLLNLSHVCGGPHAPPVKASISTEIHFGLTDHGDPHVIPVTDPLTQIALGSSVHDSAALSFDPANTLAPQGSVVTFYFYSGATCDNSFDGDPGSYLQASGAFDVSGETSPISVDPALAQGPLAAGTYSYRAFFTSGSHTDVANATSDCEPFQVKKADVTISTDIHNAAHQIVVSVPNGSIVHDTALISGTDAHFAPDLSKVSFKLYTTSDCSGHYSEPATVGADESATDRARSADSAALTSGAYSYSASFAGDANYNAPLHPATCEPLTVRTFGYTMGFWGNVNGQALLAQDNAFTAPNAVTLGLGVNGTSTCWILVDSAGKSKTILPNTLNGISILANCNTSTALDSGINTNSLNTLLAQTLALSYNIKWKQTYAGQAISGMGCTAVSGAGTTVESARDYGNYLIGHAKKNTVGGDTVAVTQSQIGAMNTLLGCLNAES